MSALDASGTPIPQRLMPLWFRRHKIEDWAAQVRHLIKEIRKAEKSGDPVFIGINFKDVLFHLNAAHDLIVAGIPALVCPWCSGCGAPCRGCDGIGLISKFRLKVLQNAKRYKKPGGA